MGQNQQLQHQETAGLLVEVQEKLVKANEDYSNLAMMLRRISYAVHNQQQVNAERLCGEALRMVNDRAGRPERR